MESLNDTGTGDPSAVPDTPMILPASSDSMNTVVDANTTGIGLMTTKACAPDTPPSLDQMQQTVGKSAESQAKELLSASAQDPSPSEQECPPSSQKQQRNDSPREKEIRLLRLPQEAVHTLLIGDSNLRKVDRRRLDRSGGTHVRIFPGRYC